MNVVYLGSGDIGLPALRWLLGATDVAVRAVVTQPDRPSGRGLALKPSRIKELAASRGVEVFQPAKIRAPEAVAHLAALEPDLLVVMAYGQILPQSLLDVPKIGAVNLHASLLPRHRGAAPVHAAILAGDEVTGITSMWMDAGLDTGDILCRREITIAGDETAGSLHDRLGELAPAVLRESLDLIRVGRAPRIRQDEALATYAPKLDRASGRIDWSKGAGEIARRVRALDPWPGCSADLALENGKILPVKIRRAAAVAGSAPAGQIAEGFRVGCGGGGLLSVRNIQPAGSRMMTAEEFCRGHRAVRFLLEPNRGEKPRHS